MYLYSGKFAKSYCISIRLFFLTMWSFKNQAVRLFVVRLSLYFLFTENPMASFHVVNQLLYLKWSTDITNFKLQ